MMLIAVTFVLLTMTAMAKDIALVTHKSNTIKSISVAELVKTCKASCKWPDGKEIKFVYVDTDAQRMRVVAEKVFGVSPAELRTMLEKMQGTQRLATDQAVIAAVERTPGALGLIDIYSITSGVNVVKLEGKLPLEPGYLLHHN